MNIIGMKNVADENILAIAMYLINNNDIIADMDNIVKLDDNIRIEVGLSTININLEVDGMKIRIVQEKRCLPLVMIDGQILKLNATRHILGYMRTRMVSREYIERVIMTYD